MAITVNNLQSGSQSATMDYTPSSVSDSVLVVFVADEDIDNNEPITAVDFGATAMSIAVAMNPAGTHSNNSLIAYLVNPGTTLQTITVTGGEASRMGIAAATLSGVDQTTPVDVTDSASKTSSSSPHTLDTSVTTTVDSTKLLTTVSFSVGSGALGISGGGASIILDIKPGDTVDFGVAEDTIASAGAASYTWDHPSGLGNQRFSVTTAAFAPADSGISGSGTPQATTATASGTGVVSIAGTGSPQATTATASGTGTVTDITGTGTPQATTATASGAGVVSIAGTGSPQAARATASGAGTVVNLGGDEGTRRQRSIAAIIKSRKRRAA